MMKSTVIILLLPVLFLSLIACGNDDDAAGDATPTAQEPARPESVEEVMEDPERFDGQMIELSGYYFTAGEEQYLAGVLMESFPPQIHEDRSILLRGELPAEIEDGLESGEPLAPETRWGWVTVIGEITFSDDVVYLDIREVRAQ